MTALRPADIATSLFNALEASEGRRKRRVRDTTADSIGMGIKRDLLIAISSADPEPHDFERWLMDHCAAAAPADGPVRAMALSIWDEWRLAEASPDFRHWLAEGAPSDDREGADGERHRFRQASASDRDARPVGREP
jgi:hypothetical protein